MTVAPRIHKGVWKRKVWPKVRWKAVNMQNLRTQILDSWPGGPSPLEGGDPIQDSLSRGSGNGEQPRRVGESSSHLLVESDSPFPVQESSPGSDCAVGLSSQGLVMPERESSNPAVGVLEVPALSLPVSGAPIPHRHAAIPDTVQDGQSTWSGLSTLTSSEFSRPQVVEVGIQYELNDLSATIEPHDVDCEMTKSMVW